MILMLGYIAQPFSVTIGRLVLKLRTFFLSHKETNFTTQVFLCKKNRSLEKQV